MDTARWGPDGWRLLHSIAYCYTFSTPANDYTDISAAVYKRFFRSIQHILPCVYCRRSYAQYMKEIDMNQYIRDNALFRHLYLIHNKVNDKLKGQGYNKKSNPSYRSVEQQYQTFVKQIDCVVGWAFLYCVVFNYPEDGLKCSTRRRKAYIDFFTELQHLLPCQRIREKYRRYIQKYDIESEMDSRESLKKWLHRLERRIRGDKCTPFRVRCKETEDCRVSKCDGETCRKSR